MSLQNLREKIVTEIPISELITRYGINLTRKPSGYVGVCPFHGDTNPSMSVSDDKRIYKCFACGAGSTHFDFVMNLNNLNFTEALKDICEKFQIDFESFTDKKEKSQKHIYAEKILKVASELYYKIGQSNHPVFNEFTLKRQLPHETVDLYKLGFSTNKSSIYEYIKSLPEKSQKDVLDVSIEIGLVKYNANNKSHYDTFRDRVIFPIWDHFGKVIGFTSRSTQEKQMPKYLNSAESFIFNKRNLLYGLHLAKPVIRKRDSIILVEGNMDQIALQKKGFENSVAIMGTALGDNSLRAIKALTSNVVLALDNDDAGYTAAIRINRQFLQTGIIPHYITFEPHKDADDFLIAEGSIALSKLLEDAPAFIDVQFENSLPKSGLDLLDIKLKTLESAFELISPLGENLQATERILKWAKKLGLQSAPDKIIENYENFLKNKSANKPTTSFSSEAPKSDEELGISEAQESDFSYANEVPNSPKPLLKVEETLICALIEHPDCLEHDQMTDLLDFMGSDKVKQYVLRLREIIFEIDIKEFKSFATNLAKDYGLEEIVQKATNKSNHFKVDKEVAKKIIIDLEKKLVKESLKAKKEILKEKRKSIQTEDELSNLLTEIHQIEKKLYSLNNPNGSSL